LLQSTGKLLFAFRELIAHSEARPCIERLPARATAKRMLFAPDERPSDETSLRYAGWRVVLACFLMMTLLFGFGLYGHAVHLA
jgi:hypothetical protein